MLGILLITSRSSPTQYTPFTPVSASFSFIWKNSLRTFQITKELWPIYAVRKGDHIYEQTGFFVELYMPVDLFNTKICSSLHCWGLVVSVGSLQCSRGIASLNGCESRQILRDPSGFCARAIWLTHAVGSYTGIKRPTSTNGRSFWVLL